MELERNELFRFMQKAPKKETERTLNALGRGKEYHDALNTEVGQKLIVFLNTRLPVVEDAILNGTEKKLYPDLEDPKMEARAEYRVLKGHAKFILSEIGSYYRLIQEVKSKAGPDPATNNG